MPRSRIPREIQCVAPLVFLQQYFQKADHFRRVFRLRIEVCDLILRQLKRRRHNEAAFGFLKLWNVWVLSWTDQSRATLHLYRKRTIFVDRAETVLFSQRGKN